jgi:transcriptional regulator with XRE-family HTH domain
MANVGYRGKLEAQEKARLLRAEGRTLADIAALLGVSKSSVSLWVRDMDIEVRRRAPTRRRPHPFHLAKLAEVDECNRVGRERLACISEEAFLVAGTALYAGEGAKRDGNVLFANTDAQMVRFFCAWFRRFFSVDEDRLRVRVYLHEGLDIEAAEDFWSAVTGVPRSQFRAPYRAKADASIRSNKHEHGCVYVGYSCSRTHREVMGLVRALLTSGAVPG